jgi:hypothetical protein
MYSGLYVWFRAWNPSNMNQVGKVSPFPLFAWDRTGEDPEGKWARGCVYLMNAPVI